VNTLLSLFNISNFTMSKDKNKTKNTTLDLFLELGTNIQITASWLEGLLTATLKPHKITYQQYYVLRALSTIHPEGGSIKYLTSHMADRMSNASRLVVKLQQKGLVERKESATDMRKVEIFISSLGTQLTNTICNDLNLVFSEKMKTMNQEEFMILNELLNKVKG
jgi:DNA-binding MarR family transcriptional regulator